MARLVVPPTDLRLAEIFHNVLIAKVLHNDALWARECRPLLHSRLDALHALVKEAQVSNANTPDSRVVEHIFSTLDKIKRHLSEHFDTGAPFTVHRLSELLVDYAASGYLLTTVLSAQKYVLALARTIMVLSKETDYSATLGDPHAVGDGDYTINGLCSHEKNEAEMAATRLANGHSNAKGALEDIVAASEAEKTTLKRVQEATKDVELASAQDYEDHDLPTNIRFVALLWGDSSASTKVQEAQEVQNVQEVQDVQDFDVEHSVLGVEVTQVETLEVSESQKPPKKKAKNGLTKDAATSEDSQFHLLSPLRNGKVKDAEYGLRYYEEKNLDYEVDRTERYSEEVLF